MKINGVDIIKTIFNGQQITKTILNGINIVSATLVNLANNGVNYSNWSKLSGGSILSNIINFDGTSDSTFELPTSLQSNTQYTLSYRVKTNTLSSTNLYTSSSGFTGNSVMLPIVVGTNKALLVSNTLTVNNKIRWYTPGGGFGTLSITDVALYLGNQT